MWKKAWQHNKHSENLLSHVDGFFSDWFVLRLAAFQGQIHLCLPSPSSTSCCCTCKEDRNYDRWRLSGSATVNIRHVACALFSDSRGIRRLPHNRPRHSNKWERAPRVDTTQPGHVRAGGKIKRTLTLHSLVWLRFFSSWALPWQQRYRGNIYFHRRLRPQDSSPVCLKTIFVYNHHQILKVQWHKYSRLFSRYTFKDWKRLTWLTSSLGSGLNHRDNRQQITRRPPAINSELERYHTPSS